MVTAVDLHVHSIKSDGSFTPSALVDYALEKGLSAFALTDHDTVDGLDEAINYAADKEIEVIPGIEFSTEFKGKDIHIVGLYIDYKSPAFQKKIQEFVDSRIERNKKMCEKLTEAGCPMTYEELLAEYPDAVITRSHYAGLLKKKGYIKSLPEAFERYIGDHSPCFVPREKVTPIQAIELIKEVGGISILAHPILYGMGQARLDHVVGMMAEAGLDGIEAVYCTYTPADERQIKGLAKKYNLLLSGGSDFHGKAKSGLELGTGYGKLFVPSSYLDEIKKKLPKVFFTDLDGTLLNNAGLVTPVMSEAITGFCERGNHFVLASGRPLDSILQVKEEAGIPDKGLLIIASNGAVVYDYEHKTFLQKLMVSQELIAKVEEIAHDFGLHIQGYDETHIISARETEELQFYQKKVKLPSKIVSGIAEALPKGSVKLLVIHLTDRSKLEEFRQTVLTRTNAELELIYSNDKFLEIFVKDAGKGNAMKYVCEHLNIPLSRSFAAGDAPNDISMLKTAGMGIAMKNADDEVKIHADVITDKSNDEDGLAEVLNKL